MLARVNENLSKYCHFLVCLIAEEGESDVDLLKIETNNQINLISWTLVPSGSCCSAWPRQPHRTLASSEIPHALRWSSSHRPTNVPHLMIGWTNVMAT